MRPPPPKRRHGAGSAAATEPPWTASSTWTASMSGAKATMQRQDVLSNNLANASTNGFRAEMAAFRAVPVRATAPARGSTRWRPRSATTTAAARCRPPAATWTWRCRARPGWPCRARRHRGLHPRRRAGGQRRGHAGHRRRPRRWWATAARSRCRPARGWTSPPTARQRHGGQRPPAGRGPAQAGDARGAAAARRRRPVPRRRRQRPAADPTARCRAGRWKAPTSARSRPWWR
jgi:hypothetical protein